MIPDKIIELAGELNYLYLLVYKELKPRVDNIIKNQIKDTKTIESILDNLLNVPTEKCGLLFRELCNYYKEIDELGAKEYLEIYKELYEEEMPKHRKKTK